MKTLNKIYFAAILALLFNSCSLKEEPYGFVNSEVFYKTGSDAYSALGYCYDVLGNTELYSRLIFFANSIGSEEYTVKPDAGVSNHELDEWRTTPTSPELEAVFTNSFIGIGRSNILIEKIEKTQMDELLKKQYKGEAFFLRGLHYFNLVRLFGQVPIRTKSVSSSSDIPVGLSSIADVYSQIEVDLKTAESLMDSKIRDGRANKIAAQAMLAKVYLNMASSKASGVPKYEFVSDAAAYYTKSADYASKILKDQTTFSFWTGTLPALWDVDNQIGNEFIYSVSFHVEGAKQEGDYSKLCMLMVPYLDGNPISFGPNNNIKIRDGWNHLQTEIPFYNSFDANDKRKTELMVSSVLLSNGTTTKTFPNGGLPYPFTLKFVDKKQSLTSDQSAHYVPVLRYSDIALVYAEAMGANTEGYTWLNKIRTRAGLPDMTAGLSNEAFRMKILEERSFELAFEGNRLFDLRRTHQIEAVLNKKYSKTIVDSDPQAYFYKIPQKEIDNNPMLSSQ